MGRDAPKGWLSRLGLPYVGTVAAPVAQSPSTEALTVAAIPNLEGKGFQRVHDPINAEVDIVFVHGLTGSRRTWYNPKTKTFWPFDLLPHDIPKARIFCWEYDADVIRLLGHPSSARLSAHGANFCDQLAGRRYRTKTQRRPLIFVCHSLGGLVTMKSLLHSNESEEGLYKDIVNSTIGVIFLGTPLRGSTLANWGSLGLDYVHFLKDVNRDLVKLLEPGSDMLFSLRDSFLKLVKARAAYPASRIIIKCYAEELGKTLVGKVVTAESAIFEGYPHAYIHADHVGMVKFSGSQDPGYISVMEWIFALVDHATHYTYPFASGVPTQPSSAKLPTSQAVISNEQLSYKLIPEDSKNIHRHVTETAVWNMASIAPSPNFLAFSKPAMTIRSGKHERSTSTASSVEVLEERIGEDPPTKKLKVASDMFVQKPRRSSRGQHALNLPSLEVRLPEQIRVEQISTWLSEIDHLAMHNFTCSKRYKATGVWLSKAPEFQLWRDSSHSTIFWLHGTSGSGKTTLSSFVVDALSANENVTVLYFYCYNKQFRSHSSILRSFLKQLYLRSNRKFIIEDFYEKNKLDRPCDGDSEKMKLYLDLFLETLSTSRTYLVLDGIDECTPDSLDVLFSAWRHLSRRSGKLLKLFVSSGERIDIRGKIETEFKLGLRGSGEMSLQLQPGHLQDLEAYVQDQAESVAKEWGIWQDSSQEMLKHANSILLRASGHFSWARRTIDTLRGMTTIDTEGFKKSSTKIPDGLEEIYRQFMAEIASADTPIASIAEKAFYWVVFGLEPLRTRDIITALCLGLSGEAEQSIQPLDAARLVKYCKGLIVVEKDHFRLFHTSAIEYLCQQLDNSLAHTYLAKICLAILTSMRPCSDAARSADQEATSEEALYEYARRFYLIHGFKALAQDRRIGPYIEADDLPCFEKKHHVGQAEGAKGPSHLCPK